MSEPVDHAKVRAEIQPLTDALTNCVTELELLSPSHRARVMQALKALFPEQQAAMTLGGIDWQSGQARQLDILKYGGGMTSGTLK